MFPGGRMDPRKMNAMMKQLGISVENVDDVERVVITTPTKEYVFDGAEVTIMKAQGTTTYQVVGKPKITAKGAAQGSAPAPSASEPVAPAFTDEDVKLVMEQAKVPREKAAAALEACDGEVASAIVKLLEAN